jgi:hypothetical protein
VQMQSTRLYCLRCLWRVGFQQETSDEDQEAMSTEKRPWAEDVAEARQLADGLSASLPSKIEVAALGVRSKAPTQLLIVREALIWRTN